MKCIGTRSGAWSLLNTTDGQGLNTRRPVDRPPAPKRGSGGWRLIAAASLCLFASGCATEERCKLTRAAELPFSVENGHMIVEVKVNGSPVPMVLDTGAGSTLLSSDAVERLKLPYPTPTEASIGGIGGTRSISTLRTAHFAAGGLGGSKLTFSVPFGHNFLGKTRADGLLGMDILSRTDLDIDFPDHKVVFYIPATSCSTPSAALDQPLYVLPMRQDLGSSKAVIEVEIAGHKLMALLDSGAAAPMLFGSATSALGLDETQLAKDRRLRMGGVGPDAVDVRRHVIEAVTIGALTISNMPIAVSNERRLESDVDMLLGIDFFRRVHVWLSFSSHSVILQFPPRSSPL